MTGARTFRIGCVVLTCYGITGTLPLRGAQQASNSQAFESRGNLQVLRSAPISTANPKTPHVESFIALDPHNSKHMIAAATVGLSTGELGTKVYVTFDGGARWTPSRMPSRDTLLMRGGDGAVYFNRKGTALLVEGTTVNGQSITVVSRSMDGGRTWESPAVLPYRDRPYIAFDTTGRQLDGTIYVGGQAHVLSLSHSTDDGRSFSYPRIISRDLGGVDPTAPIRGLLTDMLVTPDGNLVMPFWGALDMRDSLPNKNDSVIVRMMRVLVSDDGGHSFFAVRKGPRTHITRDFRYRQADGAPRAAIDQSRGHYRGHIYLVWPEWNAQRRGYVVQLASSADLGRTWKTTIVNDNTDGHDPGNPAVAVNRDGIVAVIWNDRRDDPKNRCWRLYGAISTDGGETFYPNVKLSSAPTCVNTPNNWLLKTWDMYDTWTDPKAPRPGFGLTAFIPVRFPNGGDTQGLTADPSGVFHAAWINGKTGTLQLWYTAFAVDSQIVARVRVRNAEHMNTSSVTVPPGEVDVTQELTFEMSDPRIDFDAGILEVTMRVVNPTARVVNGPIHIVVDRLRNYRSNAMGLANFRVANADNEKADTGAIWTFSAGPEERLSPNEKTSPRVLRFSFTGGIPMSPTGYFEPAFYIFARRTDEPSSDTLSTPPLR